MRKRQSTHFGGINHSGSTHEPKAMIAVKHETNTVLAPSLFIINDGACQHNDKLYISPSQAPSVNVDSCIAQLLHTSYV